jgi:hypothetical protein
VSSAAQDARSAASRAQTDAGLPPKPTCPTPPRPVLRILAPPLERTPRPQSTDPCRPRIFASSGKVFPHSALPSRKAQGYDGDINKRFELQSSQGRKPARGSSGRDISDTGAPLQSSSCPHRGYHDRQTASARAGDGSSPLRPRTRRTWHMVRFDYTTAELSIDSFFDKRFVVFNLHGNYNAIAKL